MAGTGSDEPASMFSEGNRAGDVPAKTLADASYLGKASVITKRAMPLPVLHDGLSQFTADARQSFQVNDRSRIDVDADDAAVAGRTIVASF